MAPVQAQAQPQVRANCEYLTTFENKVAAWMDEQIAAGRTRFVTGGTTTLMCAW